MKKCLKAHDVAPAVIEGVVQFYTESGGDEHSKDCNDFPFKSIILANGIFESVDFYHTVLESSLYSNHWLMETSPSDELVSVLSTYPPGTVLADRVGHFD